MHIQAITPSNSILQVLLFTTWDTVCHSCYCIPAWRPPYSIREHWSIIDVISDVQKDKPEAAVIVLGDFNQEQFKIPDFMQYVKWRMTSQDRTINLCYCNTKNSHNKCLKKDPLAISYHDNILLLSTQEWKKLVKIQVKQ